MPQVIWVGDSGAYIVRVTQERIEYIDNAGRQQFVDLQECANNWVQWHDDHRQEFIPLQGATDSDIDAWNARCVGERGGGDPVWWIQLANEQKTRFEFETWEACWKELQGPLMKAGWNTFDTE